MQINHTVVQALTQLRALDLGTLAKLAHVTGENMSRWVLAGDEDAMAFDQQIEVLSYLGIRGEAPRPDVVHFWSLHEPLFGRAASTYEALHVVLQAFGPAEVTHLSREAEEAFTLSAKVYFGLKFEGFLAILKITSSPFRSISFDPDKMNQLTWAEGAQGVSLPRLEFDRLEPGSMQVRGLGQHLAQAAEASAWAQLRLTAQSRGMRADQVAHLLTEGAADPRVRLTRAEPVEDVPAPRREQPQAAPVPREVAPAQVDRSDISAGREHLTVVRPPVAESVAVGQEMPAEASSRHPRRRAWVNAPRPQRASR